MQVIKICRIQKIFIQCHSSNYLIVLFDVAFPKIDSEKSVFLELKICKSKFWQKFHIANIFLLQLVKLCQFNQYIHFEILLKMIFANVDNFNGVNWGQTWTKNETFGYVLLLKKIEFLKMLSMTVRYLWRLPVVKNSAQSSFVCLSYHSKSPKNWSNWVLNPKN